MPRKFCAKVADFVKTTVRSADFQNRHRRDPRAFVRRRILTFERVFFIQLALLRSSLARELERFFESLLGQECPERTVTDGAFCRARLKMAPEAFREMNQRVTDLFYRDGPVKRWYRMRLLSFDGSLLKVSGHAATKAFFGRILNGAREYSMARAVQLYDVLNGVVVDAVLGSNRVGERDLARRCLQRVGCGDMVLLDIGYPGFVFFAELLAAGAQFCARISAKQWQNTVRPFLESGEPERVVELRPDGDARRECRRQALSTDPISVRVVRVDLPTGDVEVLFTSLTDTTAFPSRLFGPLYTRRWRVEEAYKTLKCRIELENFSGKSVCAALQDYHARMLMLTLTVLLTIPAAQQCRTNSRDRKLQYQLNLTDALAELRKWGARLFSGGSVRERLEALWRLLAKCASAVRPGRHVPRNKTPKDKKNPGYAFAYKPLA